MTSSGSSASPLLRSRSSRRCCCFFCFFSFKKWKRFSNLCQTNWGNQKSAEIRKRDNKPSTWPTVTTTCEVPPSPFLCGQRMQSTLLPDSLLFVLSTSSCRPKVLCNNALSLQRLATQVAGVSSHVFRENSRLEKYLKIVEDPVQ